jgi:hypothetical protein
MAAYAADALKTDTPWKFWQFQRPCFGSWNGCDYHPEWVSECNYRRKPDPIPKVYTVRCTLPIKALSPEKAAWQFRELLTSGMGMVLVTDENGTDHEMMGIRPKGEQA